MKKEKVELLMAFFWICPECGNDNFERAIVPSITDEEKEEIKDMLSIEKNIGSDEIRGCIMMAPLDVKCKHCKEKFETVPYEQFGDDELLEEDEETYE